MHIESKCDEGGYQVEAFCEKDPSKQATSAGSEVVKRNNPSDSLGWLILIYS